MRNLSTRVPKSAQSMVATLVRTIFEQPDAASVWPNTPGSSTSSPNAGCVGGSDDEGRVGFVGTRQCAGEVGA
jgi:hypothetical protein